MKINELITSFTIAVTNEENDLLSKIHEPMLISNFSQREQYVAENLIRKSLLIRIKNGNDFMVVKND